MKKKNLFSILILAVCFVFVLTLVGCNKTQTDKPDTGKPDTDKPVVAEKFTITFDSDGGTEVATVTVEKGKTITAPDEPTKEGYTFAGWYLGESATAYDFKTIITANITLTAHWTTNTYTVKLNKAGGTCSDLTRYTQGVGATLPIPSKTGYTFDGWYDNETFNGNAVTAISKTDTGNKTYWAKWSIIYQRINKNGTVNANGEYILFGEYPQTKVTDEAIISALGDYDANSWTSYDYYVEGEVGDYMKYTDKKYNGEKYRGVYFTSYRPYYVGDSGNAEDSGQDDNGYNLSTVYWFKYEPIKWHILNETDGKALILCDIAIDSQTFDYKGSEGYKNNYAESTIRTWLNETFYNTAFSDMQKALIQTTMVDNSVESTGYEENQFACENTNDKVFLLSYAEVTNDAYGFNSDRTVYDEERQKKSTDYAKSQGCYQYTDSENPDNPYEGNCFWWLRSPYIDYANLARNVDDDGRVDDDRYVDRTDGGVLPALEISLS